mmetsp:Transcript_8295/g.17195  ORF Transcript_8295/g.17195 Transcript_8295/m.17195 type:complete len:259 (-) Transcript_8295:202-978(-)
MVVLGAAHRHGRAHHDGSLNAGILHLEGGCSRKAAKGHTGEADIVGVHRGKDTALGLAQFFHPANDLENIQGSILLVQIAVGNRPEDFAVHHGVAGRSGMVTGGHAKSMARQEFRPKAVGSSIGSRSVRKDNEREFFASVFTYRGIPDGIGHPGSSGWIVEFFDRDSITVSPNGVACIGLGEGFFGILAGLQSEILRVFGGGHLEGFVRGWIPKLGLETSSPLGIPIDLNGGDTNGIWPEGQSSNGQCLFGSRHFGSW